MDELIKEGIAYIKPRWHRKSTLLILLLFSTLVMLFVFSAINFQGTAKEKIGIISFLLLIITAIWTYTNLTPKASKGKIGFAIGIRTNDPEQQMKIKRDFVEALRDLLYKSKYKYSFELIEIPDWLLEKIDSPDVAQRMLYELQCSFMVYGRARTTMLKGERQHVLNLEGVVAHKPIASQISKSFSKEFADVFPRQLMISSEGDLFQFEFTASWINVVSRYIIGIAALLSGDFEYAQELLESLQVTLLDGKAQLPAVIKIRDRLPKRLRDVYLARIRVCYED